MAASDRSVEVPLTWRAFLGAAALVLTLLWVGQARAEWPERTITIIVPFAPGGPNDLVGRLLAAELAPVLKQNVIVENRAGAVGNIGLAAGARATPDGYTLVEVTGVVLINPSVSKVAYDPLKDFAPVAYLGAAPNAIVTRPDTGIKSVADLIAKAKAEPGKLTFATAGVGSVSQLAVELLKLRADIDLTHVPFQGAAPALQAALAGTTTVASVNVAGLINYIRSGSLTALVQTGAEHWPDLPDVPTMQEAGIPDAVVETSQMLLAPAGTPEPIVKRLSEETRKILQKPEVREKLLKASFAVKYEGPEALHARMMREIPKWKEVVERGESAAPRAPARNSTADGHWPSPGFLPRGMRARRAGVAHSLASRRHVCLRSAGICSRHDTRCGRNRQNTGRAGRAPAGNHGRRRRKSRQP